MAIKMIHHVNVQISDRDRTRAWYEKVLGAEFLDRGPALNRRQLQLRLGSGEIHFTETSRPIALPSSHFAIEVDDWDATLAHLDELGIPHVRTSAASTESPRPGTPSAGSSSCRPSFPACSTPQGPTTAATSKAWPSGEGSRRATPRGPSRSFAR